VAAVEAAEARYAPLCDKTKAAAGGKPAMCAAVCAVAAAPAGQVVV